MNQSHAASSAQAAIAGAVAGDLIKIRFQVQLAPIARKYGGDSPKYVGLLQSVRSIHAEEGFKSFWRGNLAATGLWISYSALQFGSYRSFSALWSDEFRVQHGAIVSTLNGALAGVFATVITYPLDLFRTIFASQGVPKRFPTIHALALHTYQARGLQGFYSGLAPTLFQIAPYMGLSFGIYSSLNSLVASSSTNSDNGNAQQLLSYVGTGAVAGLLSKMAVYPLDTVKKRMQMRQVPRCETYGVIPYYETSWMCFVDIVKREGLRGLYKGTTPSLIKSVVTHSSTFATYELTLMLLQRFSS